MKGGTMTEPTLTRPKLYDYTYWVKPNNIESVWHKAETRTSLEWSEYVALNPFPDMVLTLIYFEEVTD